jgi:ABC-type uncharacterized transport system substrate-binding protein
MNSKNTMHRGLRMPCFMQQSSDNRIVFRQLLGALALLLALALPVGVMAHPHMWVQAQVKFNFNAAGQVTGVTQTWVFDELFSSYAKQGLPETADNRPPQAELDKIGQSWIEALADPMSHYFTTIRAGKRDVPVAPADRVAVDWNTETEQMSLQFELPFLQPVNPQQQPLVVSVADPTFYVAYSFDGDNALSLVAAPERCTAQYEPPKRLDMQTAQRLAAIGPDVTELPDDLMAITQTLQHRVELTCQ